MNDAFNPFQHLTQYSIVKVNIPCCAWCDEINQSDSIKGHRKGVNISYVHGLD